MITVDKLINQVKACNEDLNGEACKECPYHKKGCSAKLLEVLADKLDKAYDDIVRDCSTCIQSQVCSYKRHACVDCDRYYSNWEWRGNDGNT